MASFSDVDLAMFWKTLQAQVEQANLPELSKGLEQFSTEIRTKLFEAKAIGSRDGELLRVTVTTSLAGENALAPMRFDIAAPEAFAAAPGVTPFCCRPWIVAGDRWDVNVLDASALSAGGKELRTKKMEAGVARMRSIWFHGQSVAAYEVEAREREPRRGKDVLIAHYSARGNVLRVRGKISLLPVVTLVRDEADLARQR
jgi:hypothetical protein